MYIYESQINKGIFDYHKYTSPHKRRYVKMMETNTFYLSRVLGRKVISKSGEVIGKVQDILVSVLNQKPQVIALKIRTGNKLKICSFSNMKIMKLKRQYVFQCSSNCIIIEDTQANTLYLRNHVLDRQLVDIDGRKLVRVNDLRLATIASGTYVIAVDVGLEGLLRRIGIAKPIKILLDLFHGTVPNKLILWSEVETVDFGHAGIKLSSPFSKLSTLHVSDLADIIKIWMLKCRQKFSQPLMKKRLLMSLKSLIL
jgi:sporulation protein YlmC with PRC-barrel domain